MSDIWNMFYFTSWVLYALGIVMMLEPDLFRNGTTKKGFMFYVLAFATYIMTMLISALS